MLAQELTGSHMKALTKQPPQASPNADNRRPASLFPSGHLTVFVLITARFFLWGTPNNLNDVLIRQLGGSLIVMAIVGGAILTPLMGLIAEARHAIAPAYIVPLAAYVVIAGHAFLGAQVRGVADTATHQFRG